MATDEQIHKELLATEQERQTEELQQKNGVELTVFYGNDTPEFLLSKTVTVPEIDAGEIIGQLQDA